MVPSFHDSDMPIAENRASMLDCSCSSLFRHLGAIYARSAGVVQTLLSNGWLGMRHAWSGGKGLSCG